MNPLPPAFAWVAQHGNAYASAMHPTGPAAVYWRQRQREVRREDVRAYLHRRHERQERRQRKEERSSNTKTEMAKLNASKAYFWSGDRPAEPKCRPEFWTSDTAGPAALSAVYAWMMQHPEWLAVWVNPHLTMKWDKKTDKLSSVAVGGHYRRRPGHGKCPHNLAMTCKFDRGWCSNSFLEAPFCAARERWGRDGCLIPRDQRQLAWH